MVQVRGWTLFALVLGYLVLSWFLFYISGEQALTSNLIDYLYFAATTASTVGYGDMSPVTTNGKLVAAIWFFPGALLVFTAMLSKITSKIVQGVRLMVDGHGNFERVNAATVIIGYHPEKTEVMINDLLAGQASPGAIILLANRTGIPVPDGVRYVRAERLDTIATLKRAGVTNASKVLIYTDEDAQTFNICLAIRELNPDVHVAAYFDDRDTARRASHLAHIEAVVSRATESLVRAAQDPGSSRVLMALSSATLNSTIYSKKIEGSNAVPLPAIELALNKLDTTLLAVSKAETSDICFRPFPEEMPHGSVLYYVAEKRINSKLWENIMGDLNVQVA
ncbi:potassium channel family protein [Flexibacterium corallicola]|uniref:potassium channel family protein n=1 Tax=Flexibacterium corallicola TaxID=3037259 RepID=UPI00286EFBC4|nr:ion channel [Pseudovibrio sp. M1P-2-3]